MTQRVIGWKLDLRDRSALLQRFRPVYPDVDADHVTLRGHTRPDEPPPPQVSAAVVGRADDGSGLECLVVAIDGATERPDGSTYHITWSLDAAAGRKPGPEQHGPAGAGLGAARHGHPDPTAPGVMAVRLRLHSAGPSLIILSGL
jgi:hypothetical protein